MRKLLASFFLLICQDIYAQLSLSLEEAFRLLEVNNLSIRQSELHQKIAKIDLDQSYYSLIPNLGFNINNQHTMGLNFDQITGQLVTGNQWSNTANATVSSTIFTFQGLKAIYIIKANKLNTDLAKLDTEKLKHELKLQLLLLFFQTMINADLHNASVEQAKLSTQQLEEEQIKIEVGKGTLIDVAQARNKLAVDQLNVSNAKSAYELSLLKLKQLLEFSKDTQIELKIPQKIDSQFVVQDYIINGFDQDLFVKQANKKIDYSSIQTNLARSSYYPIVSISSGYGTNYSSRRSVSPLSVQTMPFLEQMNQNRSLYIGLGVSFPIFDQFNRRSSVKKSLINTGVLELERDKIISERYRVLDQAHLEYQAAIEEQKALQVAYEASKANYEAMNERYSVGKSSSIDLYKVLTDYNIAEFRRINSKYNVLLKEEILKLQFGH